MELFSAGQYLGLLFLGFGVGCYGTLIGAGGGFVLMPLLLLLYPDQGADLLTSISLAVVFFNALSGSEAYAVMKRIDYRSGLIFSIATVPGAILGALHTSGISRHIFNLIFALILLMGATFLVLKSGKEFTAKVHSGRIRFEMSRLLVDSRGIQYEYRFNWALGMAISAVVGYISSFLGIGGGIIHVPALCCLLGFPIHIATATSHFMLAIMALTGTLVHIFKGTFAQGAHLTIVLGVGVVLGAQIGARLSEKVQGGWIIRGLAIALALVGVRILVAAL
jgi:uncharacterized membrane protein YfcA